MRDKQVEHMPISKPSGQAQSGNELVQNLRQNPGNRLFACWEMQNRMLVEHAESVNFASYNL